MQKKMEEVYNTSVKAANDNTKIESNRTEKKLRKINLKLLLIFVSFFWLSLNCKRHHRSIVGDWSIKKSLLLYTSSSEEKEIFFKECTSSTVVISNKTFLVKDGGDCILENNYNFSFEFDGYFDKEESGQYIDLVSHYIFEKNNITSVEKYTTNYNIENNGDETMQIFIINDDKITIYLNDYLFELCESNNVN